MASFQRGEPMLLVKKCNFFKFFFSLKIRLEVRVNNVLDRKKNFFRTIKTKLFIVSKLAFFQRGLPMLLVKTCNFFLYLFSVKEEHEIRFNHVLNRKETFFDYKNKNFSKSQKWHPSKGVNPCF